MENHRISDEDDERYYTPRAQHQVLNPMHIITLKHETTWGVRLAAKIKSISEQWFSHILLLGILCFYAVIGALIFYWLEKDYVCTNSDNQKIAINVAFLSDLWNIDQESPSRQTWLLKAEKRLEKYLSDIQDTCSDEVRWTVWSSLFYCGTVLTTIGYGNIAPSTDVGRAVTIVYAFLGIPLMLMVLADLGKLFTKAIKFVFRYARRFYKAGTFQKTKGSAIDHHKKPLQYMTVSWRTVSQNPGLNENTKPSKGEYDNCNQVTTLTLHNDDLYKDLDFMNANEANHKHIEMEDEFNLPVTLAIAMVLGYMVVGAMLFAVWEEWSFFEAFYFVFISMSTVGFGDYVPSNQTYMMGAFVYLVFGLTLTSMCINVIQEKLSATFQKAKVRIGNTIGLDVNTLLREDGHKHANEMGSETPKKFKKFGSSNNSLYDKELRGLGNTVSPTEFPSKNAVAEETQDNPRKELLLTVPLEKRFTFYDSPYSTIQNDDMYDTVSSVNSLSTPRSGT